MKGSGGDTQVEEITANFVYLRLHGVKVSHLAIGGGNG